MRYIEFRELFGKNIVFSVKNIKSIIPEFHPQRLSDWIKKGYIKKLRKNYFVFSNIEMNEQILFFIANRIYSPSYVSMETALSFYNIIPEGVYTILSVSTMKTKRFETEIGKFQYRKIKRELFSDYQLMEFNNIRYKIALPEKAVLDYVYFHNEIKSPEYFVQARFNAVELIEILNLKTFEKLSEKFRNSNVIKRINYFKEFFKNATS